MLVLNIIQLYPSATAPYATHRLLLHLGNGTQSLTEAFAELNRPPPQPPRRRIVSPKTEYFDPVWINKRLGEQDELGSK